MLTRTKLYLKSRTVLCGLTGAIVAATSAIILFGFAPLGCADQAAVIARVESLVLMATSIGAIVFRVKATRRIE